MHCQRVVMWAGPVLLAVLAVGSGSQAADWYVSPGGQPSGQGTRESPWDLEGALLGRHKVQPGDTVRLLEGTYRRRPREQFEVRLAGTKEQPVHVRPAAGARARIDGGLLVVDPAAYLWIWDLELFVSEPQPDKPVGPGSHPADFTRPWGGLNMQGGRGCKYVHLVIHDCRQGVSFWAGARDSELYGCLICDNGWPATDRGHGHAVYTQNRDGVKVIADCIMTGGHSYTLHAYGSSRADVDNYLVEGNICYQAGTFLIGGGKPSRGIRVRENVLYRVPMQLGYAAPSNEDCEVRDNLVLRAGLSINKFKTVVSEGNTVVPGAGPLPERVIVRPSRYEPGRAHLALVHPQGTKEVRVDLKGVLREGERFVLLDPKNVFGPPVRSGVYDGKAVAVPVKGEFTCLVVRKP